MASERRSETRSAHQAASTPDDQAPWADLEVVVPTDRDHTSVVARVECALVELTHEAVGAVFVSRQVGQSTRTQYVAADGVGESSSRNGTSTTGWAGTRPPSLDGSFATRSSPSSRGRPLDDGGTIR